MNGGEVHEMWKTGSPARAKVSSYIQDWCIPSKLPKDMVIEGENVPYFSKMSGDKMRAPNGPSNVFQILGDIWK